MASRLVLEETSPMNPSTLYPPVHDRDKKAVLRVTTYRSKDLEYDFVKFDPRWSSSIGALLQYPFSSVATECLGYMNRLPMEMVHKILRLLDVASFLRFRQANRWSRQLSHSLPEYQVVAEYASNVILALCKADVASQFTMADIRTVLETKDCPLCAHFAGLVFLPTLQRCCLDCLFNAPQFDLYQVDPFNFDKDMTLIRTIPKVYNDWGGLPRPIYASTRGKTRVPFIYKYTVATALPQITFDGPKPHIDSGVRCLGCPPVALDRTNPFVYPLYYDIKGVRYDLPRILSKDGYLNEHFRWCREAQMLWKSYRELVMSGEEPPDLGGGWLDSYLGELDVRTEMGE